MASVNKVILVGNLGRDPEVRTFATGDKVCNLNIATSETWKDKHNGEKRERTEWHRVAIFGGLAGVCERHLRKGSKVYLEGQLETRKWQDASGQDKYSTEVVLRPFKGEMVMLDGGGAPGHGTTRGDQSGGAGGGQGYDGGGAGGRGDIDDEIPF